MMRQKKPIYRAQLYQQEMESKSRILSDIQYSDDLIEESPLNLFINHEKFVVFMRTPLHDLDLVCGFLWSDCIIEEMSDIRSLQACDQSLIDRVDVYLADGVRFNRKMRHSYMSSSCGLCSLQDGNELGNLENVSLDLIELQRKEKRLRAQLQQISQTQMNAYLRDFNQTHSWFKQTGGCHAAALYSSGHQEKLFFREDVGRHNAVDKVLGAALRAGYEDLSHLILFVSSRAGFEIVQKAVHVGVGAMISLGAASALAHRYSLDHQFPLYSFVRKDRCHRHLSVKSSGYW